MAKWLILLAGMFLFASGMTTRTYSFEDPEKHCFQMDYIGLYGCFGSSSMPPLIAWGATLIGAGFIVWSLLRARHSKVTDIRT